MYKALASVLALVPFAAAQPAHLLRVQQPGSESKVFSYSFNEDGGSYLGIDPRDVTSDRVGPLKLKEESGVEVTTVDADAPAGKAGLREHDVILTINGAKMESVEQLRRTIRETPVGRSVNLGISRDGQLMNITVQLGERPNKWAWKAKTPDGMTAPIPPIPPTVWKLGLHTSSLGVGIGIDNMTPQLAEYFGVKSGSSGTLITSVGKDTPAAKAGLRAGDVIISVDKDPVREMSDLFNSLRAKRGATVSLGVIREKHEVKLSLAVPSHPTGQLRRRGADGFVSELSDSALSNIDSSIDIELPEIEMPDMKDVETEIAMVGPEIERANAELLRGQAELDQERPEVEKAMAELDAQKDDIAAAAELQAEQSQDAAAALAEADVAKQIEEAKPELEKAQKEMESHRGELQKQMRQLHRQMKMQKLAPQNFHFEFSDGDMI